MDERGLFLKYYEALLNFVQGRTSHVAPDVDPSISGRKRGASCNGVDVWYDAQGHLPSIPLEEVNISQAELEVVNVSGEEEELIGCDIMTIYDDIV